MSPPHPVVSQGHSLSLCCQRTCRSDFTVLWLAVLVRVSIAVKRHHDCDNSYKETFDWGWLIVSEIQSIIVVTV